MAIFNGTDGHTDGRMQLITLPLATQCHVCGVKVNDTRTQLAKHLYPQISMHRHTSCIPVQATPLRWGPVAIAP